MLTCLTGASLLTAALALPVELPDVIVTHLSSTPETVTVHLQNQGPGVGKGMIHLNLRRLSRNAEVVRIDVPSPQSVFGVAKSAPVSLKSLGVKPGWSSELIQVDVQADDNQARTTNKDFVEQIERSGSIHNDSHPYAEKSPDLPDLVVEGVIYDGPDYVRIVYANRGKGRTGADFIINLSYQESTFRGNHYYRFRVPPAGHTRTTGGLTMSRLGLKPGMSPKLTAVIDPEGRVRETDSKNNTWTGVINLR